MIWIVGFVKAYHISPQYYSYRSMSCLTEWSCFSEHCLAGWEVHKRLSYVESNWPYFVGFGLPLAVFTSISSSAVIKWVSEAVSTGGGGGTYFSDTISVYWVTKWTNSVFKVYFKIYINFEATFVNYLLKTVVGINRLETMYHSLSIVILCI